MQSTQPLPNLVISPAHESTWRNAWRGWSNRLSLPGIRLLPLLFRLMAGVTVAVVRLPVAYLVMRALGAGEAGLQYLLDGRTLNVVWNSLALMAAVVLSSALIAVPVAGLPARPGV